MRLSNYSHDVARFNLALRMLSHEARTHTISLWTGLSPPRVRRLAILQRREVHHKRIPRHRGPSPTNLAGVLTSPSLRREAAVLAGFCRIVSVIPDERVANAATALPTVGRGERLVYAFELFQGLVPHTRISLDQLVLLVVSLAEGIEWDIETCARCAALIVVDRLSVEEGACEDCQRSGERRRAWVSEDSMTQEDNLADSEEESCAAEQLDLFMDSKESDDSS